MTSHKILLALEPSSISRAGTPLLSKIFSTYHQKALQAGITLPKSLFNELEAFYFRNKIINEQLPPSASVFTAHCMSCFKAHALTQAVELGLNKKSIAFLDFLIAGETGHLGYYLDAGKLMPTNHPAAA